MIVALTYDLREEYLAKGLELEQVAEFDSMATIEAIEEALGELGLETERVGTAHALIQALALGKRWGLVFNICEGLYGRSREAQVPAILEVYQIPYTFGDPLTNAITLDKAMAKRVIAFEGLATAPFFLCTDLKGLEDLRLKFPLFVKPNQEGTGKGIDETSLVLDPEGLREKVERILTHYDQPALIEEYLPGREFTVGILGTGHQARVIGTMEVKICTAPKIYSFEVKQEYEKLVTYEPVYEGALKRAAEELAISSYRILGLRDGGRVDVRLREDDTPMFIEANPLPGLHPTHSDLPMIGRFFGISYKHLIQEIVKSALQRQSHGP